MEQSIYLKMEEVSAGWKIYTDQTIIRFAAGTFIVDGKLTCRSNNQTIFFSVNMTKVQYTL